MKRFLDVMYDDTKNARKIKSCDYNHEGKYPIIDQSSKNVIGYTDEIDGLYKDVPVIIFGDHTRRFKLVEEPFFIGADGTKVLKLHSSVYDYKFIYYYLLHKKIPDTGYNRHFKWVKELEFPEIPRSIQSDIVKKFEVLNDLIFSKNKLLELFDILIKSRFEEVFNLAFVNVSLSRYIKELKSGKSLAGESYNINKVLKTGAVSFDYFNDKEVKNLPISYTPLESHRVNVGDVIISRMNTAELVGAAGYVWSIDDNVYLPDRLWSAILDENINSIFVWQLIIHPKTKLQIQRIATGTSGSMKNISKRKLLDIKVPWVPIIKQNELSNFVSQINKLKSDVQKSIDETQLLMDSLMQEYFG